jgi:hypothetical protein
MSMLLFLVVTPCALEPRHQYFGETDSQNVIKFSRTTGLVNAEKNQQSVSLTLTKETE